MTRGRDIQFEAVRNFRDLGGIAVDGGLRVRHGTVYRSGELAKITDSDVAGLVALDIGHVFDLRSLHEREKRPSRHWTREPRRWHGKTLDSGADLQGVLPEMLSAPGGLRGSMIDVYRRLPYEQANSFATIFRAIADNCLPLLLHCAAGKDRTGAFVALLLQILGASPAAVMEDYLASNRYFEEAQRYFLARINQLDVPATTWHPLLRAEREYLVAMQDAIDKQSGGLDGYLRKIGIGPDERAAIRLNMLESDDER